MNKIAKKTVNKTKKFVHTEKGFIQRAKDFLTTKDEKKMGVVYDIKAIICALVIISSFLYVVAFMPKFGRANNPVNNIVSRKYIEDGIKDTGAVNFVAGMILNYRAFDTLGESTVLFVAATTVLILLFNKKSKQEEKELDKEETSTNKRDVILMNGTLFIIPTTLIFGIYVLFNGHLSPGGGFSGGSIMGAVLILYNLAFGHKSTKRFFNYHIHKIIKISALSFYALSMAYTFYVGANKLQTIVQNGIPGNLISSGLILPLNICVGLEVACTMYGFYSLFDREEI